MPALSEAAEYSFGNQAQLQRSQRAGCYYCLSIFPAEEVTEFTDTDDESGTALCPVCGLDAVLGDASGYAMTEASLISLKTYWFGERKLEKECPAD